MKKIGKAKADPKAESWVVEAKPGRFIMNQRLVDLRPEVKALKYVYSKHAGKRAPSKRRMTEREAHHKHRKDLKAELDKLTVQIYAEILKESFTSPILLIKDRTSDHPRSDWRYCLYQGIIYEFDRPGCSDEKMIEEINAYNARRS